MVTATRTKSRKAECWSDALTCDTTASVVCRTRQAIKVRTGESPEGRYVSVCVGRVLVYVYDLAALKSHTDAWLKASHVAADAFPAGYACPEPRWAGESDDGTRALSTAAVSVSAARSQPVRVDGATTMAAARPYVQVAVGRLTVACLDPEAVGSWVEAWQDARTQADGWLRDIEAVRDATACIRAFERTHRPIREDAPEPEADRPGVDLTRFANGLADLEARMTRLEQA